MKRLFVQFLLLLGVLLFQADASGQSAPIVPAERRGDTVIRQTSLDVVILVDPAGNLITQLPGGWPLNFWEEFHQYIMRESGIQVPPFIIRNVTATGRVREKFVEVEAQIEIGTSTYQPVRVPLGFKEGILPSVAPSAAPSITQTDALPFRYTGPGSMELTIDPQEQQYVAFIIPQSLPPQREQSESAPAEQRADSPDSERPQKPEVNQRHTLSLTLWFPLAQHNGTGYRLPLSFPQSLSSQFILEVPMTNITPSVIRGTLLNTQEDALQQTTALRIQGLRTDTEIIWEKKKIEVVDDHPVLTVDQASISVKLDAGTALYDAVLPVSSATGSFDQLQIRLPQGCLLDREMADRHAAANNYSVGEADAESIVTIQFQQKTTGPVPIQLRAVRHFEGETAGFTRELAGFEVLGAERQTGSLQVSIFPPEMRPHWELIRGVRRTEAAAPGIMGTAVTPALSPATSDTRFEFISQPFFFRVRVTQPRIRVNVKPKYHFHISRGTIVMDAWLSYTISGAKAETLYLQLSDSQWRCEVASNFVDAGSVELDDFGMLTLPLNSSRDGVFDINLRASRTIPADDEQRHRIILPIPQPQQTTWTESASVAVIPDNNVEILPIDEQMTGLTRQTRREMLQAQMQVDFTASQQEPLFYRTESGEAEFVADLVFRRQQINAAMQTDVRLLDEFNQVTQTIDYHASYESVDRLYFLIPRLLDTGSDVQVRLENQTLPLRDTIAGISESIPDNWVRKMVLLPESMFRVALSFEYSVPPLVIAAVDDTTRFALPFIVPVDVPVSEHRIHFSAPQGYRVELQDESRPFWESYRDPRRFSANTAETFRTIQRQSPLSLPNQPLPPQQLPNRIALFVSASDKNVSGASVVERAWLQTWLTGTFRRDLATYTVRSTNDAVQIQLPPNAVLEHPLDLRINRQQIPPNISSTGLLTIPIVPEQHNQSIEITLDYRFPFEMSSMEMPIILPSFERDVSVQYQYWQVILPQSKHIVGYPVGWTLEYDWTWNGLFWWRVPSIRRSDIGFSADPALIEPPVASSQYVFSHLQPPSSVTLYIVSRSLIIFGSSSLALLIGLLLIYVPQSRYAGSLFGLGVALAAVLFYQPPLMLLTLQAATFGVFLALGAGYVYRIFHRQNQWIPPIFPLLEDMSYPYGTPPPPQSVHEVIMDSTSKGETEMPIVNNGLTPQ